MLEGHERTLLAAQGYSELSMFDDALAELDSLPEEEAKNASVVELRTVILMQAKPWKPALTASRELCRAEPRSPFGRTGAKSSQWPMDSRTAREPSRGRRRRRFFFGLRRKGWRPRVCSTRVRSTASN